ncbi:MAG: hypothetical protein GY854_26555 [Deltaproteobacteria bacterium]|nr:hypothetical protein [Deltaproteobacteria bacterium]
MKDSAKKKMAVVALSQVALVFAIVVEWLAGSACVTPQVVREVQTAKPLKPDQTQISVSGGLTDTIIETTNTSVFAANPNADLNVLIRKGREEGQEIQVPINLSARLGPGMAAGYDRGDASSGWSLLGVHAAGGLFFKRSRMISSGDFAKYFEYAPEELKPPDWQEEYFWVRPLYKAWVFGPTAGVLVSGTYPYSAAGVGRDETGNYFVPDGRPFVSPFVGFYARYIHEKRKEGFIRLRGLLASISYFPMDIPLMFEDGPCLPLGIETFIGVFVGSERSALISSLTLGVGTSRITMPRLVIGFTFGSKGRLI